MAILAAAMAALMGPGGVAAAAETLRIEPATQAVAAAGTFTARLVQTASVPTAGTQATITFDPAKLQVSSVTWGEHFAAAPILVPGDVAAAIAAANASGELKTIAAAFIPPGSVPPGDVEFLVVEFTAVGCGEATLGLPVGDADALMLDGRDGTYGGELEVATTPGTVTLCGAAAATPPVTGAGSPAPDEPGADAAGSSDGGLPLLPIALAAVAVVVIAAGGLWWMRRARPTQP